MKKLECEISFRGIKSWYLDNKLHREDGAAIEYPDGNKEWYLNNRYYCDSWDSPYGFVKGFVRWIEAVKELQGKK